MTQRDGVLRIELPGIRSLQWRRDGLIDWVGGGNLIQLDGKVIGRGVGESGPIPGDDGCQGASEVGGDVALGAIGGDGVAEDLVAALLGTMGGLDCPCFAGRTMRQPKI